LALAGTASAADDPDASSGSSALIENAVVKIFSTLRAPDPFRPWSKQSPREVTGSGVVIEGKRILTNAHVVLYAGQIQVQANREGNKVPATVEAIAPGIDLAVLKLEDDSFFDNRAAVTRANTLPEIKDTVLAYGFPTGGASLSITKGIVSRIEFANYNYPVSGLRIQVDAAINPGNSGGPAFAGDKMIGLAYAVLGNSQSIGYIIPNEEIELFLKDIADGHYDGKPAMFDEMQTLDNPALRTYLKLDKSVQGIVVQQPFRTEAAYPLKEWDVITSIGDMPIDNEGMVKLGNSLRVKFTFEIPRFVKDGKIPLTILRNNKPATVQLPAAYDRPLIIADLRGGYPSYFVYGPIVFSTATTQFLGLFNNNASIMNSYAFNRSPLLVHRGDAPDREHEELVVVAAPFFPHKLVNGYGSRFGSVVQSVNGVPVRSLRQLVAMLRDLKDEFVIFRFDQRAGETLVFPRKEMLAATEDILTDNGIRSQGSPDLLEVWQSKR
jgi:S1-C subfamily serine protease